MAGKPGRSGPPKGNLNNAKNGTRLERLTLGELPKTMRVQQSAVRKYRRALESLVTDAKGQVSTTDAHLIDEATTAEVHAAICRWLLRTRIDKMTVGDVARCSEQVVKAKHARNCAVSALHLDAPTPAPWLGALELPAPEPADTGTTDEGSNGHD